jgi:peptidoglycan LD-endopeptidase CwlK
VREVKLYRLSKKSLGHLDGVHPDLVRVVKRAITLTKVDFGVIEGLRTLDRQKKLIKVGKSRTLKSKHLADEGGFSRAVDLSCYVDGKLTWDEGYYRWVIQAMMTAAILEGVPIKAGGLWRTFLDGPHFELDDNYYD